MFGYYKKNQTVLSDKFINSRSITFNFTYPALKPNNIWADHASIQLHH